jgi:hypothetical protein
LQNSSIVQIAFVDSALPKGDAMTFIDLVLVVCAISDPSACRVEHLYRESRGSIFQCMMRAPTEIAKWSTEHPAVRVTRWQCVYPDGSRHI